LRATLLQRGRVRCIDGPPDGFAIVDQFNAVVDPAQVFACKDPIFGNSFD
jgi:hypothetical protein